MRSLSRVSVPTEVGEIPAFASRDPANEEPPAGAWAIFVPSVFGVTESLRAQLGELADDVATLAFDPFRHVAPGPMPFDDLEGALARMRATDFERVQREVCALGRALGAASAVVGVGICFGGSFVVGALAEGALDGVVTWHGSRLETQREALVGAVAAGAPMRHHVGGADSFVPPEAVEAIRAALAGAPDAFVLHPDAEHGFTHRGGPDYRAVAERAALSSVLRVAREAREARARRAARVRGS